MLLSRRSIECNVINKLLPDRCTHAINEPKLCCVKCSSSQGTCSGTSFNLFGEIARAHTHLRTLNLIVKTIAIGPADSSLSISQNSDHPSRKKQLVFFIENKNRYGTLAKASATAATTTTTTAMTITMDIKHNTIIQYTRRLSAKKMRKPRKKIVYARNAANRKISQLRGVRIAYFRCSQFTGRRSRCIHLMHLFVFVFFSFLIKHFFRETAIIVVVSSTIDATRARNGIHLA